MIGCKSRVIYERSNIVPISKNLNGVKNNSRSSCDLTQNCFDPSKSSPPNEFMKKLKQRLSVYDSDTTSDFNRDNA